jgi:hypothetical protein
MSKAPSPLLGYNNNVRHKSKVFHIQTEDSGVKYGHIITHLFMDGGRILKSVKTSYQEYVGNAKMSDIVRQMMKQQHKAMFIALRDGKFDHLVDVPTEASQEETKGPPAGATKQRSPATVKRSVTPTEVAEVPLMTKGVRVDASTADAGEESGPSTERSISQEALTLDIDALERAAAVAESGAAAFKSSNDLPPPPTNLFREKTATGSYRAVKQPSHTERVATPPPPASNRRAATPPPPRGANRTQDETRRTPPSPAGSVRQAPVPKPPSAAPRVAAPAQAAAGGGERRYAPTRPASIFGQSRPQQGKTIFGEDLISDKSLDEVILSYLADDLEPPPAKKK